MGIRFRRSVKLMPGVRMNLSGSGASFSFGGRGARINVSSRGTRATVGLLGTGLSYTTTASGSRSGRRSAQQLAAAHRRMLQERARAQAAAEVERIEAQLAETLGAWRDLPAIPGVADYQRQLIAEPFQNSERLPARPDLDAAERAHREEVRLAVIAETPQRPRLRFLWLLVIAATLASSAPFDLGLGLQIALTAGLLTWFAVFVGWRRHLRPIIAARASAEWPKQLQKVLEAHAQAVSEYEQRAFKAQADWTAKEHKRVGALRMLMSGDLARIGEAVTQAIEAVDFPFETQCTVVVDD